MRARKGLGRSVARQLRLKKEEAKSQMKGAPSPFHYRRVMKIMKSNNVNRKTKLVVFEHMLNAELKMAGLTHCTGHRKRQFIAKMRAENLVEE